LTNVLSNYEINKIIEATEDSKVAAALITEVISKGAPDNITIIWSEIIQSEQDDLVIKLGAANE